MFWLSFKGSQKSSCSVDTKRESRMWGSEGEIAPSPHMSQLTSTDETALMLAADTTVLSTLVSATRHLLVTSAVTRELWVLSPHGDHLGTRQLRRLTTTSTLDRRHSVTRTTCASVTQTTTMMSIFYSSISSTRSHQMMKQCVHLQGRTFIHKCRSYAWPALWTNRQTHGPCIWSSPHTNCTPAYIRFWALGVTKFPKMGDSLPRTPINHRAKFDTARFMLDWKICNHTNKQNDKQ